MSKGLMYRGGPTTKTSARIAGAIIKEFGKDDGLVILDWLIERIQTSDTIEATNALVNVKEKSHGGRRDH